MKSLILYFSTTGNTKLACEYIAKNIPEAHFELVDITRGGKPDFSQYQLVGFAAFADFIAPSKRMTDFIRGIPTQNRTPAFVFNTYGNFNGGTLKLLGKRVRAKGFEVLTGLALNTPENVPPLIAGGLANTQLPNDRQLAQLAEFIGDLREIVADLSNGRRPKAKPLRVSWLERLLPATPRIVGRWVMGRKQVDTTRCTRCGVCEKSCPYGVISLNPFPTFAPKKCYGCWSCYNHCPTRAIYTKIAKDAGHYPQPHPELRKKLE